MSKTIEYLLLFSAGVIAGVLSTRAYFKNEYRMRAEEEIQSVKEAYRRRCEKNNDDISSKTPGEKIEQIIPYEKTLVDFGYSSTKPTEPATSYTDFYKSEPVVEAVKVDILEEEMAKKEAPSEENKPFLISEEVYSETEISFDKMSCTFYVPDKVLVDDLSRETVEVNVIGEDNLDYLVRTDEKIVYIRNENLGCDLEISRDMNSLEETGDPVWFN